MGQGLKQKERNRIQSLLHQTITLVRPGKTFIFTAATMNLSIAILNTGTGRLISTAIPVMQPEMW